ncbi:type IV pili methyl-accepting chemotaxis transducer N-terminal domain-containing protein [Tateyamaria sp. SN6-1]|uniref:type IV pili methyl-accepting chemotaxis transducer N-terminal domain-containing protein n=1 Tax=Tateyamaria sp. SN6-1 TaxID=3092148 RepID=UPI0039F4E9D6
MRLLLVLFLLSCGPVAVPAAQADDQEAVQARQKINLSGRQRMLTQRMTAAACLVMINVDRENRILVAQGAHGDFERALHGLVHGDPELNLLPTQSATVRAALAEVDVVWRELGPAVLQLSAGDLHTVVIGQILAENLPALRLSNAAVGEFVKLYGSSDLDPALARAIDVAGRQRMLSQKMMKEACFVSAGLSPQENAAQLRETIQLFDASLQDLRQGDTDAGIAPPPTDAVAEQLETVAKAWVQYKSALNAVEPVVAIGDPRDQLAALAQQSDAILSAAHQAVLLYVAGAAGAD